MILAIIERIEKIKEEEPFDNRYYLTEDYKKIFEELNIILFPVISEKNLDTVCKICDGLIVTGTASNIPPKYYQEEPIEGETYEIDEYRLDKEVIKTFANCKKPILGICGGMQSINVAFGGTLHQRIQNHKIPHLTHKMNITTNSFLERVYQEKTIAVNSYHRQAVKDVATGFQVSAVSEDGIIEAIEKENIIGVQWHPENMLDIKFFKKWIEEYCKACITGE